MLTPAFAFQVGAKLAVAAVSIPHVIGTAVRFWLIRKDLRWDVMKSFGTASALGGLCGALLHASFSSHALAIALGLLLILTGLSEWTGFLGRIHFEKIGSWIAGALSGLFGGLVGNQGGVRSAALLTYKMDRHALIATSTLTGLMVDAARMPVYLATEWSQLKEMSPLILLSCLGVVAGTFLGKWLLGRIPEKTFRQAVATLVICLGIFLLFWHS